MKKINISILNFWNGFKNNDNFILNLLKEANINYTDNIEECDLLISGPFIDKNNFNLIKNSKCKKYLFISEPIEKHSNYIYSFQLYKEKYFEGIIGCINNIFSKNFIKYPLYILYLNKNTLHIIDQYVKNCDLNKEFCTLINTHDNWNTRKPIYEKLKNIGHITCPSNLLNNCSNEELNKLGNTTYINKFLFNICAENTLTEVEGYITEKIINCCMGGAIPIYCGWFDEIDSKIMNKNRILFYNSEDEQSLQDVYNKVKELMDDRIKLKEFYSQDVFMECAYDTIKFMDNNLKDLYNKI
tara:strand:- start:71 stop:967 length:897 start_codon:yes stop_codon:yes gene_type:complete